MSIILISANGNGAGKTTFAKRLGGNVIHLADVIRKDLEKVYPAYNWYSDNKTQIIKETGLTMRQHLINEGQERCASIPDYYAQAVIQFIKVLTADPRNLFCIPDVRKVLEVEAFRAAFPGLVTHMHLISSGANHEPEFDNEQLGLLADYVVTWE